MTPPPVAPHPAPHPAPQTAPHPQTDGARPLTAETVQALNALCDRAEDADDRTPLVLRVTGAPDGTPQAPLPLVNKWERALRRLERLDRPTVALATGDCGGTALDLLLATDHRIATPGTRLLPATGPAGVWPGMALYRLAHQAGVAAVRGTALFGTPLDTARAHALHLLDRVTDDPAAALAELTAALGDTTDTAVRRQLLTDAATTGFDEALGRHLAACDRMLRRTPAEIAP
ncbi:enoyl-CoA-hydratase DpgB [Kitasatospora sp. NPDC088134]|uniref:enoyl-CoA-hydratase DpgB n=1 Tax=Kitasatospora sp. NPDC088134 TaxID=3364071 RepID=UPI00380CDD7D